MVVKGLLPIAHGKPEPQLLTKKGYWIYDGSASGFAEWKFRATVQIACFSAEDKEKTASHIMDGLGCRLIRFTPLRRPKAR